ncbi:hypothetical protein B0H17DRAFT_1209624 [Mycena rosella]|uniref:Uncharacterized protein n=1 Tax=Mycena rosella TaxID=1033263 RepID=A0AAD7CY05_MYCRO|nr:hypothetical protein B0H17DRAFT_1209624 [Mycena rosella]
MSAGPVLARCDSIATGAPSTDQTHVAKASLNALTAIPAVEEDANVGHLDKTALNYANLFGFQTALKLQGNQFNKDMRLSTWKTTLLKSVGDLTQIVAFIIGGVITLNFENIRLIAATCANIICVSAAACMAFLSRHLV